MTDRNQTWQLIKKRRTLRSYASRPIDDTLKSKIIQGALRAPTGGNMMTYSILEIEDPVKKEKLSQTCGNLSFIADAPFVLIFLADLQRWYDYYKFSDVEDLCNHLNIPYQHPQIGDLFLAICDAVIAAHNASLVAESFGLGSCYIGDVIEHIEVHREMFQLPRWVFPITMLCFGYPKRNNDPLQLSPRFDSKYIHFIDTYHRLTPKEFQDMFQDRHPTHYHPQANNLGQHYYLEMISTDYIQEINRSARKILEQWQNN